MSKVGKLKIDHESIKNALKGFSTKPEKAILEYIWNGFDAFANRIDINYSFPNEIDGVLFGNPSLSISDDGKGWDFSKTNKIELFFASDKKVDRSMSLPHGHRGIGRCTFSVFSQRANWKTIYENQDSAFFIDASQLNEYQTIDNVQFSIKKGTSVSFDGISPLLNQGFFEKTLINSIQKEFSWFLILFPDKKIFVNDVSIDETQLIREHKMFKEKVSDFEFDIQIVQWKEPLTDEFSRCYFVNSLGEEVSNVTTGLNLKSDIFYHSVFVKSNFFDSYKPRFSKVNNQSALFSESKNEAYHKLMALIRKSLIDFRKRFLKISAGLKILEWKQNNIFPKNADIPVHVKEYEELVSDIYVAAPQLFSSTTDDQRRVTLRMLATLLGTDGRDNIIKILDSVFSLSSEDKNSLAVLLGRTSLSNIINTTKDIARRIDTISSLEKIIFEPDFLKSTLEVAHLQKILDDNFWLFGESYRLFASTEGSIAKTLRRLAKEILFIDVAEIKSESKKELDLLLIREDRLGGVLKILVVEIKRPSIKLGKKEYDQIINYKDSILSESACNGDNIEWEFILVGNSYDEYISDAITNQAISGEKRLGLVQNIPYKRTKVYIRKWSDVINGDLKTKYQALTDKLNLLELDLSGKMHDEIVDGVTGSVK